MAILTDAQVTALRTWSAQFLPEQAAIQRATRTRTSAGGYTDNWTTEGTVACRRRPRARVPAELQVSEQPIVTAVWLITLPALTDVRATDRLVIDGTTYEVLKAWAPKSWEITRRVEAVQVEG